MDDKTIESRDQDERAFLHDLAGPLVTCSLVTEVLTEEVTHPHLKILRNALEKLDGLLKERRKVLLDRMKKTPEGQ